MALKLIYLVDYIMDKHLITWIYSHKSSEVWECRTCPFPNFALYIWKWISNFIPYFIMDLITHPYWIKVNGVWHNFKVVYVTQQLIARSRGRMIFYNNSGTGHWIEIDTALTCISTLDLGEMPTEIISSSRFLPTLTNLYMDMYKTFIKCH